MTDLFKTYIKARNTNQLMDLITTHPEVLDEVDDHGTSGLLHLAYNGLDEAFRKAIECKKSFTFHEAIVCGKKEIVEGYLSRDLQLINAYSKDGFAPVSLAAFFNRTEIAVLLLEKGSNPGLAATNAFKVNALHSAVAKQNYALCKLLIEYGVDVNATQAQHITALHAAAHHGNMELVKLLVDNGAQIDLKAENGLTARDFAQKDGHVEIKNYLEAKLTRQSGL